MSGHPAPDRRWPPIDQCASDAWRRKPFMKPSSFLLLLAAALTLAACGKTEAPKTEAPAAAPAAAPLPAPLPFPA